MFAWGIGRRRAGVGESHPSIRSLAVLPLANVSNDPEQEFFADGMTDELITDLAKVSALRVISRTSVMRYRNTQRPVAEIAKELGADAVIEGTVLRSGNSVRITVQLIQASTDATFGPRSIKETFTSAGAASGRGKSHHHCSTN